MADRTTVIESDNPPAAQPPSDRVLELAERVGAMAAREQERDAREAQLRSEIAEARALAQSASESVSALSSRTESAERQAEAAAVVAVATAEKVEKEEEEEEDQDVLSVTPDVETRVEITQTPIKGRSILQKMFFGK